MTGKWKQKSKKKSKGNAVLQKYMVAVDEFIKSKSGTEAAEDDRGLRFVKKKSRKELRREKRKMKKAKMKSYYEGKKTLDLPVGDGENSGVPADTQPQQQQKKKKIEKAKKELSKSSNAPTEKSDNSKAPTSSKKGKKGKKVNTLQESRKMALLEANEDEMKSVVRAVGAAVRLSPAASTSTARALPLRCPALRSPGSATTRPFTRSLWMLNNNGASSGYRPKLFGSKALNPSVSCGCGALHTEGDKAFGDFLSDELKEERKIQKTKSLPKMSGGWELEMNGTEAKLSRTVAGEKITVTFNVNNSIPPNFEEEAEQGQQKSAEEEPDIVSTPNFVVEVTKQAAKHSLVFDCHFPEDEMSHGEGEEESDIFAIREVSFQPEGDSDWKETSYTLNTDSLDWALYDHLMDFLADRGIDNTFADELMELSTAVEHQEYIKFLEDLQGFVKCN